MSCSFCRRAEDPLEGGVSAPPLALAVVDFCVFGVSVNEAAVVVVVVGMDVGGAEAAEVVGGDPDEAVGGAEVGGGFVVSVSSFLGDFVLTVGN